MEQIRLHFFQHVPFEGLGNISEWAASREITLSATRFFNQELPPDEADFDGLIIMGGPMGIHDEQKYPWLKTEKEYIVRIIEQNKKVLGVCLGAQLIAAALGARVYRNAHKEIGWFDITLTEQASEHPLWDGFVSRFPVLHWHGDTFDIPEGAVHLAHSAATRNQAFIYDDVLALQFHLDLRKVDLANLMEHGAAELSPGKYIQSAAKLAGNAEDFLDIRNKMFILMDRFFLGK